MEVLTRQVRYYFCNCAGNRHRDIGITPCPSANSADYSIGSVKLWESAAIRRADEHGPDEVFVEAVGAVILGLHKWLADQRFNNCRAQPVFGRTAIAQYWAPSGIEVIHFS